MQDEILDHQEEQGLLKELHEGGCQEVATSGNGASKNVESACSWDGSHGKVKIEKADGSSREKRGLAGAVLRETRDLGIKWPHW